MAMQEGRLSREYKQWSFCQDLLKELQNSTRRFGRVQHANMRIRPKIQLGRWLMTLQFYRSSGQIEMDQRYPLLPQQHLLGEDSIARRELNIRIQSTFEINESQARSVADEMLGKVSRFLRAEDKAASSPTIIYEEDPLDERKGKLRVENFSTECCVRVKHLVRRFGEDLTAILCLRYDPLSQFKGGESGLSVTAVNSLHTLADINHIGFSSPLNCPLLGRQGVAYCSLFADTFTDEFGCLGDFFSIDLASHPGGWILDPPFVPPLLDATVDRVEAVLRDAEVGTFWFVINFPNWKDSEAWRKLNESDWKTATIEVEGRSFVQQDIYGGCYRANINLCLFVLGQMPDNVDLIQLRNQFTVELSQVEADWVEACENL